MKDRCLFTWNPGVWPYVTTCVKKAPHVKKGDTIHEDAKGRTIQHHQENDDEVRDSS